MIAMVLAAVIGVGTAWQLGDPSDALATLGNPHFQNWIYDHAGDPNYLPTMFNVDPASPGSKVSNWTDGVKAANKYPAQLWRLGNEPAHRGQDAAKFAAGVRQWQVETSNPIAVPGVLVHDGWARADWELWLDEYLEAGGPIPDYWQINIFARDASHWEAQYMAFVEWTVDNRVERPVIIAETNASNGNVEAQIALMGALPEMMSRLPYLERVYWYSAQDIHGYWEAADLLDADGQLTAVGELFMSINAVEGTAMPHRVYLPGVAR